MLVLLYVTGWLRPGQRVIGRTFHRLVFGWCCRNVAVGRQSLMFPFRFATHTCLRLKKLCNSKFEMQVGMAEWGVKWSQSLYQNSVYKKLGIASFVMMLWINREFLPHLFNSQKFHLSTRHSFLNYSLPCFMVYNVGFLCFSSLNFCTCSTM